MEIFEPPAASELLRHTGIFIYVAFAWLGYLALSRFLPQRAGHSVVPSWPILVMLWCLGSLPDLLFPYFAEQNGVVYWDVLVDLMWDFLLLVGVIVVGWVVHPSSVSFRHGNRSGVLGAVAAALSVGFIAWAWASVAHARG